eukprot:scaffold34510_cov22-Prasinocladus_malaysianus.AAC.1
MNEPAIQIILTSAVSCWCWHACRCSGSGERCRIQSSTLRYEYLKSVERSMDTKADCMRNFSGCTRTHGVAGP